MAIKNFKIGFMGSGNITQAVIRGLVEGQVLDKNKIYVSNRSPGKLQKVVEQFGVVPSSNNEHLIENCDVLVVAVKPQDFSLAIEPVAHLFRPEQIVISLAAGITLKSLRKNLFVPRLVRVMLNTPSNVRRGVIGYCMAKADPGASSVIEDLFGPLGFVTYLEEGDKFDALLISTACGTGFVYELMTYWQEWIEERGIEPVVARRLTVETFLGAAQLALANGDVEIAELQARVTSKKGVTAAGVDSMRELELERTLRYSFEEAAMRNQEIANQY